MKEYVKENFPYIVAGAMYLFGIPAFVYELVQTIRELRKKK